MNLNISVIKRLSALLDTLHTQSCRLDELNIQNKSHKLIENNNLFSQHLFASQSDKFSDYCTEIKHKLTEFTKLYINRDISDTQNVLAKASLDKIEQQLTALFTAIDSNSVMHNAAEVHNKVGIRARRNRYQNMSQRRRSHEKLTKAVLQTTHQLHEKLAEHHEFERRLINMISDREKQLTNKNSSLLNNEVLALHQRLGRCRKAIYVIETDIAKTEKH